MGSTVSTYQALTVQGAAEPFTLFNGMGAAMTRDMENMKPYLVIQKNEVRFTLQDTATPEEMIEKWMNLGAGLAALFTLSKGRWVQVF